MEIDKLITQTKFARLVKKPVSRINLLISLGRIRTKKIAGVTFVINDKENVKACTERIKKNNADD